MDRMPMTPRRSLPGLIADLWRDSTELLRGEAALAKAEIAEKASRLGAGAVWLGSGIAVCLAGAIFLLVALVAGLAMLLPEDHAAWLSPLIVGIVVLAIGAALIAHGRLRLSTENLKPTQSVRSMRKDVAVLKEHIQ